MFILPSQNGIDPHLVISATDILTSTGCLYSTVRTLDERLGRARPVPAPSDPMAARAALLGEEHEQRVLDAYRLQFGAGVKEIPAPLSLDDEGLTDARDRTLKALRSGADVVYQGVLYDGSFYGRADFLVRQDDGSYAVFDTKLARSAKNSALIQLAAYADQLTAAGIPVHPVAHLILGSGEVTDHPLDALLDELRKTRRNLTSTLEAHRDEDGEADWNDNRWSACMKKDCAHCTAAIEAAGDLLLVRGMTKKSRATLIGLGVTSFEELLEAELPDDEQLRELQEQARMQNGTAEVDGSRGGVSWQLRQTQTLDSIPDPDDGDIFFDFEGDPLHRDEQTGLAGIEYLFGLIEGREDPAYRAFTAHDMDQERKALIDFVGYVTERLDEYPDLRIYHYAAYEATALRKLAARHGVLEGQVEYLVENVLFDLLPVVRKSLRISETSMSIKKLEPLYMDESRVGVANGAASVAEYGAYRDAVAAGDTETARTLMAGILAYNEYDCYSTLKLRDWLLSIRPSLVPA